jgi:RNA polymerase sigma-70 factor (ECF subfamily)
MTPESFKEKYFSLHKKLYRIACAILENEEDAEDIVQDTYYKLWDKRKQLVSVENPEAYSVTIVKNLCMDFLGKHKILRMDDIKNIDIQYDNQSLEDNIDNRDTLDKIKHILKTLPEKQRKILKLSCFAGLSNEEIEKVTDESAVNVRVLLSRAKKTIKEKIMNVKQYDY